MAKICFINAYETSYLGTRVLASYMLQKGHEVHNILLGTGEYVHIDVPQENHEGYQAYSKGILAVNKATKYKINAQDSDILTRILTAEKPDVIGFSARSTNNWLLPVLVPVFKSSCPQALLIAGGFGPTLEPELYLKGGFDCVVRCDGEEALAELMDCVKKEKNGQIQSSKYYIKNTVWNVDGKIIINSLRPQDKNLSKYGEPLHGHSHFSFINNGIMQRFYDPEFDKGMYYTYFGRGCIGHCSYCSGGQWSSLYKDGGAKYYKRRNRDVIEIINELKKLPEKTNHIWFVDEYFGLSSQKTLEFCQLFKKYIGRTFFCYLNYNYMLDHKHIFYALVDAGLIGTGIGFQTGSENFAREQYHRNLSNEHLLSFTQLCFDTNLFTGIHLIGGNCYETEDIFRETIELMRKLPFSIEEPWRMPLENIRLRPHPKTPITFLSPRVVTSPMSAREWFYRAVLCELARITNKDEFDVLYRDKKLKESPENLNKLFLEKLLEMQRAHYDNIIRQVSGRRIVFYGAGELYQKNKDFFSSISPDAFIIDSPYPTPVTIDGIPVYQTDDFLKSNKDDDIVYFTFIMRSTLPRIKLNHFYGIENKNIHSITTLLEP